MRQILREESKEETERYWKSENEGSVFRVYFNFNTDEELREDAKLRILASG
jgi:hypothetical protein